MANINQFSHHQKQQRDRHQRSEFNLTVALQVFSLQESAIKVIIQNIDSIFRVFSLNLPEPITIEILKKFSIYKWKQIIADASNSVKNQPSFEYPLFSSRYITSRKAQNYILCKRDWSDEYDDDEELCIWRNYYRIKEFNLFLCKTCYKIFFKELKRRRFNSKLFSIRDHSHLYIRQDNLHNLYRSREYWCNSEFDRVLFDIYEKNECCDRLHNSIPNIGDNFKKHVKRFVDSADEDSDI